MEDVQLSAQQLPVALATDAPEMDEEIIPAPAPEPAQVASGDAEEQEPEKQEPETQQGKGPQMTVEVIIPVKSPERRIEPDHYYDDGNVPVFKPVCSPLHAY